MNKEDISFADYYDSNMFEIGNENKVKVRK